MHCKNLNGIIQILAGYFLVGILLSCKPGSAGTLDDTFSEFYEEFHRDSAFQMAHIIFPLSGVPEYADTTNENLPHFKWSREDWVLHKPFAKHSGFTRKFREIGDGMILETIIHDQARLGMERRFARMHDGWYLIFYAGMNPIQQGSSQ